MNYDHDEQTAKQAYANNLKTPPHIARQGAMLGGSTAGYSGENPRDRTVTETSLDRLSGCLDQLDIVSRELRSRLRPLIAERAEKNAGGEVASMSPIGYSSLTRAIDTAAERVRNQVFEVEFLLQHLEV